MATAPQDRSKAIPSVLWSINNPTGVRGLIAIDKLGDAIRFFDPQTLSERKAIAHKNHHEVAVSPDHELAFATEFGKFAAGGFVESGAHISIIDLDKQAIVGRIPTGACKGPHGMRFDADGGLWVIFEESGELGRVDLATMTLDKTYSIGARGRRPPFIEITPDGRKIYVSCKTGNLIVFDTAAGKVASEIEVPHGTEGIAMSPDGSRLYAAENTRQDLLEIDTGTDRILRPIPLAGAVLSNPKKSRLIRLRFSPDGRYLVSTNYASGVIHIHDAEKPADHVMLAVAKGPQGIAFTADGADALIANHDSGLMTRINLSAAKATEWFEAGTGIEALTFF